MITVIMTAEVSKMADYIICNGKIVNGKNEAPFEGNIIIEGSRIKKSQRRRSFLLIFRRSGSWMRRVAM